MKQADPFVHFVLSAYHRAPSLQSSELDGLMSRVLGYLVHWTNVSAGKVALSRIGKESLDGANT